MDCSSVTSQLWRDTPRVGRTDGWSPPDASRAQNPAYRPTHRHIAPDLLVSAPRPGRPTLAGHPPNRGFGRNLAAETTDSVGSATRIHPAATQGRELSARGGEAGFGESGQGLAHESEGVGHGRIIAHDSRILAPRGDKPRPVRRSSPRGAIPRGATVTGSQSPCGDWLGVVFIPVSVRRLR